MRWCFRFTLVGGRASWRSVVPAMGGLIHAGPGAGNGEYPHSGMVVELVARAGLGCLRAGFVLASVFLGK
jgi:hypothetical protein